MSLSKLKKDLRSKSNSKRAKNLQRFFKTGKGEYGEGDVFLGITVPESRKIAQKHKDLGLTYIKKLLSSKFHEERLVALLILVHRFSKGDEQQRKSIFAFYLKNTKHINNWDLVDLSSHKIVGEYLSNKPKKILYKLARSKDLWERRISVISTFRFIRDNKFNDSLKIAAILLKDEYDLIHKAVGWMLREIGKKSLKDEEKFLKKYYKRMPRTMLRYAIERFPEKSGKLI